MNKKWIGIIAGLYIVGGGLYFGFKGVSEPQNQAREISQATDTSPSAIPTSYHMAWFVDDPNKGNFEPPFWLLNPKLSEYVNETPHDIEHAMAIMPDYHLMAFFSYVQLGAAKDLNSFINPDISHQDIPTRELGEIEKLLNSYKNDISRGGQIEEVYLTSPKTDESRAAYDVVIVYKDRKIIKLPSIPLIIQNENSSWFIDRKLSEIASMIKS